MDVDTAWNRVRWALGRLVRNGHRPRWWRVAVWNRIRNGILHAHFRLRAPDGVDIMAEEWDNLFVLDGCRFDMFKQLNVLPGTLERRVSKATATPEFLERNFADGPHHDTVYVTANPMYLRDEVEIDCSEKFFAIVDVWEDGWDSDLDTVRPEVMAAAVREAHERYPNKRILAHFVQPHHPFIGETGRELDDAGMEGTRTTRGVESESTGKKIWDRLRDGEVHVERVREAYWENLDLLFPHLQALLAEMTGRTVVTSDHGNLLGERISSLPFREYGHPSDVCAPELLWIPWLVVEGDRRKTVTAQSPDTLDEEELTDTAQQRLADLGYAER